MEIILSVIVICGSATYCYLKWLDITHPKQPDINEDFLRRLEKLEQKEELKRLR